MKYIVKVDASKCKDFKKFKGLFKPSYRKFIPKIQGKTVYMYPELFKHLQYDFESKKYLHKLKYSMIYSQKNKKKIIIPECTVYSANYNKILRLIYF